MRKYSSKLTSAFQRWDSVETTPDQRDEILKEVETIVIDDPLVLEQMLIYYGPYSGLPLHRSIMVARHGDGLARRIIELIIRFGKSELFNFPIRRQKITPLHLASFHGAVSIVRLLLSVSAESINALDARGFDPLAHATLRKRFSTIDLLKAAGASINPESLNLSQKLLERVLAPLDETTIQNLRFEIYFSSSLLARLVSEI